MPKVEQVTETHITFTAAELAIHNETLWDAGFSEGMRQWELQRADPEHPITRKFPANLETYVDGYA